MWTVKTLEVKHIPRHTTSQRGNHLLSIEIQQCRRRDEVARGEEVVTPGGI